MMIFTLPLNGRATLRAGLRPLTLLGITAALHLWPASLSAQAPGTGFASAFSGNAGKPVDIQADVLEVDDKKKTAIFRGNVSATQGDVNLKSKELYVTYAPKDKTANAAASSDAAASPLGGGNEITQIDAKGNVYVVTKPSNGQLPQNAKSDWAIFDVKKQQVTLGGDVILSQGENVIRGSKLVIDLTSGLSRFENPGSAGGQGGRMQAIFTPPPKDKDKNKEAKDKESKDGKTSAQ
jgi:lipopolysaccharide export system protein LptA